MSHKVLTTGLKTLESRLLQLSTRVQWNQDSLTMHSGLTELNFLSSMVHSWTAGCYATGTCLLLCFSHADKLHRVVRKGSQTPEICSDTEVFPFVFPTGGPPTGSEPSVSSSSGGHVHLFSPLTVGLKRRPLSTVF